MNNRDRLNETWKGGYNALEIDNVRLKSKLTFWRVFGISWFIIALGFITVTIIFTSPV